MSFLVFDAERYPQMSPAWYEARQGLPTSSSFDRILTAGGKLSAQAEDYALELAADVANLSPTMFSECGGKPPNKAMQDGLDTEPEARRWFEFERDVTVHQVGGLLSACGRFWCSPDGLCVGDTGAFASGLESKSPLLKTHAKYLMDGILPSAYRGQVHGSLIISGLPLWEFLSYPVVPCDLEKFLIDVRPDGYTARLQEALEAFWLKYTDVLEKLHLRGRFDQQRQSVLEHYRGAAA